MDEGKIVGYKSYAVWDPYAQDWKKIDPKLVGKLEELDADSSAAFGVLIGSAGTLGITFLLCLFMNPFLAIAIILIISIPLVIYGGALIDKKFAELNDA